MELRLLRYFVAVAECLNVTRAAEQLHTAQPSLSRQIRQLEETIGAPLFSRNKHRLQLTESGRLLLPQAKEILRITGNALMQARQASRAEKTITIAMLVGPEWLVFSRVIPEFIRRFPGVQILLRTMSSPEQMDALLKREINVGFFRGPIASDEITSAVYIREKVLAVMPQSWPIACKEPVPLPELAKMPRISIPREEAPALHEVVGTIAKLGGVRFQTQLTTENLMTCLNAIASGLGFCFVTEYVRKIVPPGVVARYLDLEPTPELDILMAYRKDDNSEPLLKFLDTVRSFTPPISAET